MIGESRWPSSRPNDRAAVATDVARPWGCSFSIQSDALRRSRTDLFRTIGLAQTRSHRLTQPANSLETRRSWESVDRIQFAREKKGGKKRTDFWARPLLFDVSKTKSVAFAGKRRVTSYAWNRPNSLSAAWISRRASWCHLHATRPRQLITR